MDPDMVRQQAEAEREALALLQAKPAGSAPARHEPVSRAMTAAAALKGAPAGLAPPSYTDALRLEAAAPPSQHTEPQPTPKKRSIAGHFGRFISFGLAGAMLGGGLGIVAVNYFELPAELARLAIFGPAGFFCAVCAIASFFTKTPEAYH